MQPTSADNKRFLLVMFYPGDEGGSTSYMLCSAEAGAWVLAPFDKALLARGIRSTKETPPASVVQAMLDCKDWAAHDNHQVTVTSGSASDDRARVLRGQAFGSLLEMIQYIQVNDIELTGEFSGMMY